MQPLPQQQPHVDPPTLVPPHCRELRLRLQPCHHPTAGVGPPTRSDASPTAGTASGCKIVARAHQDEPSRVSATRSPSARPPTGCRNESWALHVDGGCCKGGRTARAEQRHAGRGQCGKHHILRCGCCCCCCCCGHPRWRRCGSCRGPSRRTHAFAQRHAWPSAQCGCDGPTGRRW